MPFPILAAAALGGAALGAGSSIFGANSAADAQTDAAKKQQQTAYHNFLAQMALAEPSRNLGYQAMGDLASVYGYNMAPYPTQANVMNAMSPLSTKTVKAGVKRGLSVEDLSQMGTLGKVNSKSLKRLTRLGLSPQDIERLQGIGGAMSAPAASPAPTGQPGNMSRFFTSPDYQFRRDEGIRGIEQGAAARGGALSGNALRGVSNFNSSLAAGEYGNWFNRVAQMAGMGAGATNQVAGASNNLAQANMGAQQQQGDARASGVLGATGGVVNAANQGMYNWMLGNYMNPQQATPGNSQYGPWAQGYQFPGSR